MNKSLQSLMAAVGLSAAVLGGGLAMAEPDRAPRPPAPPGHMLVKLTEQLSLTPTQQEEVKALFAQGFEQMREDRERLHELNKTLRRKGDSFDAPAVEAAAKELGQITARMAVARARTQFELRQLLTPEQQEQFDDIRPRGEHRPKGRHKGDR